MKTFNELKRGDFFSTLTMDDLDVYIKIENEEAVRLFNGRAQNFPLEYPVHEMVNIFRANVIRNQQF